MPGLLSKARYDFTFSQSIQNIRSLPLCSKFDAETTKGVVNLIVFWMKSLISYTGSPSMYQYGICFYRGLARDVIHDVTDGRRRHVGGIFSRSAGCFNGNNVRKRPKIGNFSGPIETFQCIKSNRSFDIKIWKVFIYLHLDFLGN
jgi:hypothetical protein